MAGRRLPMFPLENVLFPASILPLHVFEPRYRELTRRCLAGDGEFGVVLISRGSEVGGGDERVDTGTIARIETAVELAGGRFALVCRGTERLRVLEWLPDDPFPEAVVADLPERPLADGDPRLGLAAVAVRRARALLSELGAGAGRMGSAGGAASGTPEPEGSASEIGWRLCALAPVTPLDHLALLQLDDPGERLELLARLADDVADDARRMLAGGLT